MNAEKRIVNVRFTDDEFSDKQALNYIQEYAKMFDLDDENRLISSSMKVEDNDTEVSLRPKNLSDYLGQEKVKEQLEIFIEAAKSRN